jgi:hypothetical protein
MPKPLAKKLTLQQRMNYPTIRHLSAEQTGFKKTERLIAGDPTSRIKQNPRPGDLSLKMFEHGKLSYIFKTGIFGKEGTLEFTEKPSSEAWNLQIQQYNFDPNLEKKLLIGTTITINGIGILSENIGLATKMIAQIERIARARKVNILKIHVISQKMVDICKFLGWKLILPIGNGRGGYLAKFLK